jgi:uncharacterized cupin superfamily protein
MADIDKLIVNVDDVSEETNFHGDHFGGYYKPITPALAEHRGALGANLTRVPPGRSACPFHYHQREDEVFFILSGQGVFRYGEELRRIRAGDCISCPAGTQIAHQLANTGDEDLVYLAIGRNDPDEVGVYPDSGKVMVRSLRRVGVFEKTDYYANEPDPPRIFGLTDTAKR